MKILAAVLFSLLVTSNILWIFSNIDQGITNEYHNIVFHESERSREQLMAMLPALASGKSVNEIISIAAKHSTDEPFEKEGCTWVGLLGFKFIDDQLTAVSPSWSTDNKGVCR